MTAGRDGLPILSEVIRQHGLSARKKLGQNFILDLNLTSRIARAAAPLENRTIIEIGPGPGGLTRALLMEGAEHVIAIERDERCIPALEQIAAAYPGKLEIMLADALEVDIPAIATKGTRIVANLPYGIATELLIRWLASETWPPAYDRMVLMFQREVAERITAQPSTKAYGRLSVLSQWRTKPRILFNLPPQAFTPPPKVDSSVVEFLPHQSPQLAGSCAALQALTAAAFGQRRKMLRQSLKKVFKDPEKELEFAGLDPTQRAETLSISDFCKLSLSLHDKMYK